MIWKGPMPCTWTIDSPFLAVHAKCGILAGSRRYEPADSSRAPRLWNFSPIAKYSVPLTTVTFSSVGCQCGGTLAPAGCRMRITKGPDFSGSPESTASFAPAPPGGKGRHLIAPGASMTCAARASGGGAGAAAGSALCVHRAQVAQPATPATAAITSRPDDQLFIDSSLPARGLPRGLYPS